MISPLLAVTALVWAVDDGEKIPRVAPPPPPLAAIARGEGNPVWSPGRPIQLFALRDEVVAFQIVVEGPADDVRVDLEGLDPAIGVERFVEHFFQVGRSTTGGGDASLGWVAAPGRRRAASRDGFPTP